MANSYGLNAYKVEIRNKYSHSVWTLRHGSKADGYKEIRDYLRKRRTLTTIPQSNKALIIRSLRASPSTLSIDGLISTGEAGSVRNLLDVKKRTRTYTMTRDEAVMSPNYFRFQLEDGRPFGVLLIEPGSTTYLERDMRNYFSTLVDPLTIGLTQIVSYEALKKLANGGLLQRVILVNGGRSRASRAELRKTSIGSDKLGKDGDVLELSIKKAGRFSSKTWKRLFSLTKSNKVGTAVKTASFPEYDEVKVEVKMGNRMQKFSMTKPKSTPLKFDITNEVQIGPDGHPRIDSLRQVARRIYRNSILPVV